MFRQAAIKAAKFTAAVGTAGAGGGAYAYNRCQPVDVVWDLDHTLIHTVKVDKEGDNSLPEPDFVMECSDKTKERYGYVRPGARTALKVFSMLPGDQYVFTAATRTYADDVLQKSGLDQYIDKSTARDDVEVNEQKIKEYYKKRYMKEGGFNEEKAARLANKLYKKSSSGRKKMLTMSLCGKDIDTLTESERKVLIDDKKSSHNNHEDNGILAPAYHADKDQNDYGMLGVGMTVLQCYFADDITDTIKENGYSVPLDICEV